MATSPSNAAETPSRNSIPRYRTCNESCVLRRRLGEAGFLDPHTAPHSSQQPEVSPRSNCAQSVLLRFTGCFLACSALGQFWYQAELMHLQMRLSLRHWKLIPPDPKDTVRMSSQRISKTNYMECCLPLEYQAWKSGQPLIQPQDKIRHHCIHLLWGLDDNSHFWSHLSRLGISTKRPYLGLSPDQLCVSLDMLEEFPKWFWCTGRPEKHWSGH